MVWISAVILSAVFVGLTSILAKCVIKKTDSDLATGASQICYFKALSVGDINKVVPIDKFSTVLTVLLAIICFGETSNLIMKLIATVILAVGIFLMVVGTLLMVFFK